MLYVSTRNNTDVFTAHTTLCNDYAPDGGQFVPFSMPVFQKETLEEIAKLPYGKALARIINLFFATSPAGLPVDFLAERNPLKLVSVNRNMIIAEAWHNIPSDFSSTVSALYGAILGQSKPERTPTLWVSTAVRVALLFGIYGQMRQQGLIRAGERFDVSVASGDFTTPMACWYARKLGLPIGTILCTCNENGQLWEFVTHGQILTPASAPKTDFPLMDHPVPAGLEALLRQAFGTEEAVRFGAAISGRKPYFVPEGEKDPGEGFGVAVVSSDRVGAVIRSFFATEHYLADPYTAFACAGLQDVRSKSRESKLTLLISEKSPALFQELICKSCGIDSEQLRNHLKR